MLESEASPLTSTARITLENQRSSVYASENPAMEFGLERPDRFGSRDDRFSPSRPAPPSRGRRTDGEVNDIRVRQSLNTSDWARARRRVGDLENGVASGRIRKSVSDAVEAFLGQCDVEPSTLKKYRRVLRYFAEFAEKEHLTHVDQINLEVLDGFRAGRNVVPLTWSKELQTLRQFFTFCLDRKWIEENPAKKLRMPSNAKPKEIRPYTHLEIVKIIAACDTFGKSSYERRRARAMILLQRNYALRVSDVATLRKNRIDGEQIFLHALKNGAPIWLPLFAEMKFALECLPLPKGADSDCPYFFWTGNGHRDCFIKTADRTLQAVFRKSGVADAKAHRFRHTLATEILATGGSIQDVANILGDSPAIIQKHYAKWSPEYQKRTAEILQRVRGTSVAQTEIREINPMPSTDKLVREGGFEPPRLSAPPPQDGVSANSTTPAGDGSLPGSFWRRYLLCVHLHSGW